MMPQEAKELSIEVWTYLAEHPECEQKKNLPLELYEQIELMPGQCPLCKLYMYKHFDRSAMSCGKQCPLYRCDRIGSAWDRWSNGVEVTRREAAQEIVDKLKAWEPENRTEV